MQELFSRIAGRDRGKEAEVERWVPTTCGYCAVGCSMWVGVRDGRAVAVKGDERSTINRGSLCVKGNYEWKILHHPERALYPMVRKQGRLVRVSWEEALNVVTERIREAIEEAGPTGVGIYHSAQLLLEEYYALGKLARAIFNTPNFDSNTRLCMASAVKGNIFTFGCDGTPGCYEDLDLADCLLLFGTNPAEMFPELWRRILMNRRSHSVTLIVADPRKTIPAREADLYLPLRPGTNIALLNSFLHVLIEEGLMDLPFIGKATTGFAELKKHVQAYSPEWAAEITGIPAMLIRKAAVAFGKARRAVTLFAQGVNQSTGATEGACLINALHLITGKIGKPGSAPFALTGQASAMSNREVGGGEALPGFRNLANPRHRRELARLWGVEPDRLPQRNHRIDEMLNFIQEGKLKVLWNIATNPAVSLPDQNYVRNCLDKVFLIVQDVFYPIETAHYADVFLPAAMWGEKTGTQTNAERRVKLLRQVVLPPGEARSDLEIFIQVARKMGAEELFPWGSPEDVFEEWKLLSRGRPNDMTGITYERLKKSDGIQWPCPAPDHPGTPRLYSEGRFATAPDYTQEYGSFNDSSGRARLWTVSYEPTDLTSNEVYPFWLNTGRIIEHYQSRTKTRRVPELNFSGDEPYMEINPNDAQALGIENGSLVHVLTPQDTITVKAVLSDSVMPGQVFIPFHFGDLDPLDNKRKWSVNRLNAFRVDPYSGQPQFKVNVCRIEPVSKNVDTLSGDPDKD